MLFRSIRGIFEAKKVSVLKRGEHGALSKIITDKKIIKVGGAYGKVSRKKNRNTREKYKA